MSNEVINPDQQFLDALGAPLAAGTIAFNVNLTSTLGTIYSDEALTIAQANPYTLDAAGRITGDVKFTGKMRLVQKNAAGAVVRTTDNVTTLADSSDAARLFMQPTYAALIAAHATTPYVDGDIVKVASPAGPDFTIVVSGGHGITSTAGVDIKLDNDTYAHRIFDGNPNAGWWEPVGDGTVGASQTPLQNCITYCDDNNYSSFWVPQGVFDVTGLTIPDDISPMGLDSSFGSTFNFTASNRWGCVIQNTTTSSPTIEYTKVQGTSHVVPSHLKITGNALQTSVLKFANGVFNGTGLYQVGVYASESGAGLSNADYCIEIDGASFDFFVNGGYVGSGAIGNYKIPAIRLYLTDQYMDVVGSDCMIEASAPCFIHLTNVYFENFSAAFNVVNYTGTSTTSRPILIMDLVSNTTTAFNTIWNNVNSSSEFLVPDISCRGWNGQYPTYVFTESGAAKDQLYPSTRTAWSFGTGADATNLYKLYGTLTGGVSAVDVGGTNAKYDIFNINNSPSAVRIDEIKGGFEGRTITIVEQGDFTEFATAPVSLAITSITRSGTTATVTTTNSHFYATGDFVTVSGAVETDYNLTGASVTVTGATTFTYEVANSPTSPATGTILVTHTNANILGNEGLPIYGRFKSAFTFTYTNGKWEYLTNNDARGLSFKRVPGPYASDAAAGTAGLVSGQLYYDNATGREAIYSKI